MVKILLVLAHERYLWHLQHLDTKDLGDPDGTTIEHLAENTETSVTVATQEQSHTSLESQNTRQELSEDSKSNGGSSDATEVELMASAQIEGDKNSSTGKQNKMFIMAH